MGTWKWNGRSKDYAQTRLLSFSKAFRDLIDEQKDFRKRIIYFEALNLIMKSRFEVSKAEDNIYMTRAFHTFMTNNQERTQNLEETLDIIHKHISKRPLSHYRSVCIGTVQWLQDVS